MKKSAPGGPEAQKSEIAQPSTKTKCIHFSEFASPPFPKREFPVVFRSAVARRPKQPISLAPLRCLETGGGDE